MEYQEKRILFPAIYNRRRATKKILRTQSISLIYTIVFVDQSCKYRPTIKTTNGEQERGEE